MEQLDQYCFDILIILCFEGKPLGFNELCKKAKQLFNFSKPTLSAHLKHLISKKLIVKIKEKDSRYIIPRSKYALAPNVSKFIPNVHLTISEWEKLASQKDFKTLAERLFNDFSTYCLLTLLYHIKTALKEPESQIGLWLSQTSLTIFMQTLYQKVQAILKKAKEKEIAELLKEWEAIVNKNIDYLIRKEER